MEAVLSTVRLGLRQHVICDLLPLMPHTSPFQCVEEILGYLKSCFSREPMMATVCVQQVREELLGSPAPRTVLAHCLSLRRCCVWQPHRHAPARSFIHRAPGGGARPWGQAPVPFLPSERLSRVHASS